MDLGDIPHLFHHIPQVWQHVDRRPLPVDLLPTPARLAQQLVEMREPLEPAEWSIYVDGSYDRHNPDKAAWAAVIIAEDTNGFAYYGHHTARITTSSMLSADQVGSSTTVELVGLLWATIIATSAPTSGTISIYCDSTAALGAVHHAGGHTDDHQLAKLTMAQAEIQRKAGKGGIDWYGD